MGLSKICSMASCTASAQPKDARSSQFRRAQHWASLQPAASRFSIRFLVTSPIRKKTFVFMLMMRVQWKFELPCCTRCGNQSIALLHTMSQLFARLWLQICHALGRTHRRAACSDAAADLLDSLHSPSWRRTSAGPWFIFGILFHVRILRVLRSFFSNIRA